MHSEECRTDTVVAEDLALLAEWLPEACWLARADGYIDWYNRAWHEYCGTTAEQMEGWGWTSVHDPQVLPAVIKRWRASIDTGEPFEMTFPLRGADGRYRPFLTRVRPLRSNAGDILRWFGVNTDVSQQVRAENALELERDRRRDVLENMGDAFVLLDRNFRVVDINAGALHLDGRPPEMILGRTYWEAWPGSEQSEVGLLYQRAMRERVPIALEHDLHWHDGRTAWMETRAYPSGEGLAVFSREVSARRQALEANEAAKAKATQQAAVLNQLMEGVIVTDAHGTIVYVNEAAERLHGVKALGIAPDAYSDTYRLFTLDGEPYPPEALPLARAALHGESVVDARWRIRHADGVEVLAIGSARPILDENGERKGAVLTLRDDTQRERAERTVRESRDRLAEESHALAIMNRSGVQVAMERSLDVLVQQVVEAGVEITKARYGAFFYNVKRDNGERYMLFALAGAARSDFAHFGMPRATAIFAPTLRGEGIVRSDDILNDPRYGHNAPHRGMPTGHVPVRSYLAVPVISRTGEVTGALIFGHEEPKRFDERSERLITGLAGQTAVAIDNARLLEAVQQANTELERRVSERTQELESAHETLRQSQKMESLGQLTGGIAHDFNNMLAVILGSLSLLGRRLDSGDGRAQRYVHAATEGARRAAVLTQRLLAFARQQPLRPEPVDPNQLVGNMSELLRHSLGEALRLETVLAPELWPINVDPNQLENAIVNLAVNARDALGEGGKLTIETQNAHLDERQVAGQGVPAGAYVLIAVSDNGSGMTPETLAKAFDPFFSTKEVGKGTGLGLSQVYGFVKQSSGHVKIYSEVGQGTTVKIYLPRLVGAPLPSALETPATEARPDPLRQSECTEQILLVEDEPAVRRFVADALADIGYRVIEADGAAAALALLEAYADIALLFTDVVMPDINGARLAEQARRRRPHLKVLFMTGYTRNAVVHNGVLNAGVAIIGKPFTVEELAAKVRAVLDARAK
ncbi:MAG: PAS domain-containing protein [Pseudomonadota bacterium]|nr:PAS domain-containing protein [Pseudomonadota bacterium]